MAGGENGPGKRHGGLFASWQKRTAGKVPDSYGHYLVTEALAAGSACFLDKYSPHFTIVRDGSASGRGCLWSPAETAVESDEEFLRLEVESDPIRASDVLKYHEVYVR